MSYEYGNDALGYRAKIGVLVPATNTIAQPEYEALRPHGVTNHVARMAPSARAAMHADRMDDYRKSLDRSLDHVLAAIDLVAPCKPDGILLGHSIDTFRGGLRGAETMRETLQAHAGGTPVILPAESFVRALEALGVGRRGRRVLAAGRRAGARLLQRRRLPGDRGDRAQVRRSVGDRVHSDGARGRRVTRAGPGQTGRHRAAGH